MNLKEARDIGVDITEIFLRVEEWIQNQETVRVLEALGDDGIQAFYIYLFVEYFPAWVLVGFVIYGVIKVWGHVKKDM